MIFPGQVATNQKVLVEHHAECGPNPFPDPHQKLVHLYITSYPFLSLSLSLSFSRSLYLCLPKTQVSQHFRGSSCPLFPLAQEWWTDPAQCSDVCGLWSRRWNPDWDGRAPPSGEKMKAVGAIRHLRLGHGTNFLVLSREWMNGMIMHSYE